VLQCHNLLDFNVLILVLKPHMQCFMPASTTGGGRLMS